MKRWRTNIRNNFGDRFLVVFQESLSGQPVFALVPNPKAKPETQQQTKRLTRPGIALGLLLVTPVHHHCRRGLPGRYHRSTTARNPPPVFPGVALCPGPTDHFRLP